MIEKKNCSEWQLLERCFLLTVECGAVMARAHFKKNLLI